MTYSNAQTYWSTPTKTVSYGSQLKTAYSSTSSNSVSTQTVDYSAWSRQMSMAKASSEKEFNPPKQSCCGRGCGDNCVLKRGMVQQGMKAAW